MHCVISAGIYKSGGNRQSPLITVFLRSSYIRFSLTAAYQRSYNKSSGNRAEVSVMTWSGTARFKNPHIKWLNAMAGIPRELQVKRRKEGKKREKGKPNEKARLINTSRVTWLVTWPTCDLSHVRKTQQRNKVYIYKPSQFMSHDLSRDQHVTCHVTSMWLVTWSTCDPSQYPAIIGLCDFQGSWLRYLVSGSYHGLHPNRQIFRKFWTYVIKRVNTPSPFHGRAV